MSPAGEPGLLFGDAAGHQRLALVVKPDGSTGLILLDPNGGPRLELTVDRAGAPHIDFLDAEGRPVSRLPARCSVRPAATGRPGLRSLQEELFPGGGSPIR